jgi:hypothetical protein
MDVYLKLHNRQLLQIQRDRVVFIKVLLPTDAQENCFKTSIKIYIKTAPTCFGVITIIRDPMVTLEFFIDIILPAALRPWGRLSL